MDRELLLLGRYKFLMFFRAFQVAFMAIIASFLFFRTQLDTTDVNSAELLFSLQCVAACRLPLSLSLCLLSPVACCSVVFGWGWVTGQPHRVAAGR